MNKPEKSELALALLTGFGLGFFWLPLALVIAARLLGAVLP
jgi:hypothetical protein